MACTSQSSSGVATQRSTYPLSLAPSSSMPALWSTRPLVCRRVTCLTYTAAVRPRGSAAVRPRGSAAVRQQRCLLGLNGSVRSADDSVHTGSAGVAAVPVRLLPGPQGSWQCTQQRQGRGQALSAAECSWPTWQQCLRGCWRCCQAEMLQGSWPPTEQCHECRPALRTAEWAMPAGAAAVQNNSLHSTGSQLQACCLATCCSPA